MRVKILQSVHMGSRGFATGTECDIPIEIASTWIGKGLARPIAQEAKSETQSISKADMIKARVDELCGDYDLDGIRNLYESVVGEKPHGRAKVETLAEAIATAQIEG